MNYSATSSGPSFPNSHPYIGLVENTIHALRLVQAARQGIIPRIVRRLNDSECCEMIISGAVFVFSVQESGIKRWTDSFIWSPSRIEGNFLVYKEMWERGSGRAGRRKKGYSVEESNIVRTAQWIEQGSSGPSATHGTLKTNGLIKKTITVTIEGSDLHLISYYTQEDLQLRRLRRLSSRPDIASLQLQPHLFRLTSFRNPPRIVIGSGGQTTMVCEPETPEPSESLRTESESHHLTTSSYFPDLQDGIEEQDGIQGQLDSMSITTHKGGGQFPWPLTAPSEMQDARGQDGHTSRLDAQQQQSWPQFAHTLNFSHYDAIPAPFSSHRRSQEGGEMDDHAMFGMMTDEYAPMFGNHPHYMAQDRHFGYETPWLGPHSGLEVRNSFSPSATVSQPNQENTDNIWSAKHSNRAFYEIGHHCLTGQLYKIGGQGHHVSCMDDERR